MRSPLSRLVTRGAYAATQLPRVAWYVGHGLAMRQLSAWARQRPGNTARPRARTKLPTPDRSRLYADMARLLRQDLANVEAGIYPLPTDHDGTLVTLLNRSRLFFEDLPEVQRRRDRRAFRDLLGEETPRQAAQLLSAEFSLSIGRLDDGRIGKAIRYAGRGALQWNCKRHATARTPAIVRDLRRPRSAPAETH